MGLELRKANEIGGTSLEIRSLGKKKRNPKFGGYSCEQLKRVEENVFENAQRRSNNRHSIKSSTWQRKGGKKGGELSQGGKRTKKSFFQVYEEIVLKGGGSECFKCYCRDEK